MAGRSVTRRFHPLPDAGGVSWQLLESPAPLLENQREKGSGVLFEDSEITVTIDWGDRKRGNLVSGLTVLTPMAKTEDVDVHVLDLGSYVGTLELSLESANGDELGTKEIPVKRRKLATEDDLTELERYWSTLQLPVSSSTERRIYDDAELRPGEAGPAEWAVMVREMLRPLLAATRGIDQRPKHAVQRENEEVPARKLKSPSPGSVLSVLRGERRVETQTARWQKDPGAAAMASRDARRVRKHIRRLRDEIEEADEELGGKLDQLFTQLERRLHRIERQGDPSDAHRARQAVLHDDRYRLLHRTGLLGKRSVDKIHEGSFDAFRPPTYQLYEQWCTWAVAQEMASPGALADIRRALKRPWEEGRIPLREGSLPVSLYVQYEMALGEWKHRPDLVLRLDTPNRVCIFDVKYRGEGEGLANVPGDAIAELHRYRDAYLLDSEEAQHKEVWSAILHPAPGESDEDWEPRDEYLAALDSSLRIGGVPLSPSLRAPLNEFLVEVFGPATISG